MYLNGYNDDDDLGIALPAIGGAITSIGGLIKGSKDKGRLDGNAKAYNAAINGVPFVTGGISYDALDFLLQKSPVSKGGGGGWATSLAMNDAWTKYNAAKAALAKKPATSKPLSIPLSLGGPVVAGLATGPLLLAGAAALGIYFLSDSGKRRR